MNCFSCRPVVQLSDEGRRLTKILQNLTYGYTFVAILKLFLGDFNNFLNDILTIIVTILTYSQTNYFMASFLVLLMLFQSFILSTALMLIIQNYLFSYVVVNSYVQFLYIIILLASYILTITLVYYSFQAYREYKALFFEQHQIALLRSYSKKSFYLFLDRIPDRELGDDTHRSNRVQPSESFQAFRGQGTTWG